MQLTSLPLLDSLSLAQRNLGQLHSPLSVQLSLPLPLSLAPPRAVGDLSSDGTCPVVLGTDGPPMKSTPFAAVFEEEATTAAAACCGTGSWVAPGVIDHCFSGLPSPPSGLLQASNLFGMHGQGSLVALKPSVGSVGGILAAVPSLLRTSSGPLACSMQAA